MIIMMHITQNAADLLSVTRCIYSWQRNIHTSHWVPSPAALLLLRDTCSLCLPQPAGILPECCREPVFVTALILNALVDWRLSRSFNERVSAFNSFIRRRFFLCSRDDDGASSCPLTLLLSLSSVDAQSMSTGVHSSSVVGSRNIYFHI